MMENLSAADAFIKDLNLKLRLEKIPGNHEDFMLKIFSCSVLAKTIEAKWRLWALSLLLLNYKWMKYVDENTLENLE